MRAMTARPFCCIRRFWSCLLSRRLKRIVIPERLTECGGVMLAQALDVLVKELERVER